MKKFLVMSDVHANYPALQAIEAFVRNAALTGNFHRPEATAKMVLFQDR